MALEIPRADRNDLVGQPPTDRASNSRDHHRGDRSTRGCARALLDHHLLDLGGTYGDRTRGNIQYGHLRIEHDEGDVEIVVHNRAILLFDVRDRQRGGEAGSPSMLPARADADRIA